MIKKDFTIDYVNANGDISNYYPDFIVKKSKMDLRSMKGVPKNILLPKEPTPLIAGKKSGGIPMDMSRIFANS